MTIRFDGQVAIVTGAGGGLGREYALTLAARGAKVVVNDLGVGKSDTIADASPAERVAAEIRAAGGEAIANHDSVSEHDSARRIAQSALDNYGRIDILINNAGILRDKSFAKISLDDVDLVIKTHLSGSIYVTHAVWPHMLQQNYGRIVLTSSIAGIAGNFGQIAYASAKSGMFGLMKTLKIEGARKGVLINSVSPAAVTRMNEGISPPAIEKYLRADNVAPVVAYLVSRENTVSGHIIEAQAGGVSSIDFCQTEGVMFDPEFPITPEMVADAWDKVIDFTGASHITHDVEARIEPNLRSIGRWIG